MIQNLILGFFFRKYYFMHATFIYSSTRSSGHHQSFFFNFRYSSKKSQSQNKNCISQYSLLKNVTHFMSFNSLDTENKMLPQHSQQPFWLYKYSANMFLFGVRKVSAVDHFWTLNNCILKAFLKQISVYLCISPSETICSRDVARFYLVRNGLREGWIISLGQLAA